MIGLKPGFWGAVWIYLLPLIYSLTFSLFGLWLNLRMPRLDWQNEARRSSKGKAVQL
ncbi:MAG: hypothetical protein R2912_08815 [Eubacteriales bacterium]